MLSDRARAQSARERIAPLRVLDDDAQLMLHEIYTSVQGEGSRAGELCTFVRLTGCHLRCAYCDTEHAFDVGQRRMVSDVVDEVTALGIEQVLVTGGEPLLQRGAKPLMAALCDAGHTVLVETSGGVSIRGIDPRVVIILDVKTPGSGEDARNVMRNFEIIRTTDEVKFVLCDEDDYAFATTFIRTHLLGPQGRPRAKILFSPMVGSSSGMQAAHLAERMVEDRVPARLSLQLHKVLWGEKRGV